jgi:uncharacterized protein with PQ loop repeat
MSRYHRHQAKKRHVTVVKTTKHARLVDRATFIVAIVEPLITIPQAFDIFHNHTAAGISLSTWVGYELLTVVWLWYAVVHKEKMILMYQGLFMIVQTFVIIGGFMYGASW